MKRIRIFANRLWCPLLIACWWLTLMPLPLAHAKDSITWMEVNMPPHFIQNGALRGQGYGDIVGELLRQRLPNYEHHRMTTNVVRHFDMFRRGDKVCAIGLYRTSERESFLHFSIPSLLVMPPALILHKGRLENLTAQKTLSLKSLLANSEFRLGISKDRSYGTTLDAVIAQYRHRSGLTVFSGQEIGENYFKMLLLDRLDGLLGLPDEAMFRAEQMGIRDQLVVLPLEENRDDYKGWQCAAVCPKNAWGQEVIARINAILVEIRPTPRYRRAYERWLDANNLPLYRRVYDEIFLATKPQ